MAEIVVVPSSYVHGSLAVLTVLVAVTLLYVGLDLALTLRYALV